MFSERKTFLDQQVRRNQEDPTARAKLIAERIRRGEVSTGQLRLASIAGDPAACKLVGDCESIADLDKQAWVNELMTTNKETNYRFHICLIRESFKKVPPPEFEVNILNAMEEYIVYPDENRRQQLVKLTTDAYGESSSDPSDIPQGGLYLGPLLVKMLNVEDRSTNRNNKMDSDEVYLYSSLLSRWKQSQFDQLKERVAKEIGLWALNEQDLLYNRVEERLKSKNEDPKKLPGFSEEEQEKALVYLNHIIDEIQEEQLKSIPKNKESDKTKEIFKRIDASIQAIEDDPDFN